MWEYNYHIAEYSNELYHYGIKGMKWGVRRYHNFDGSLTKAGKDRLKDYKTRERNEAIKRGEKFKKKHAASAEKLKTQLANQKQSGNTRAYDQTKKKYEKAKANLKRAKSITDAELKAIGKLSYRDMQTEKMKAAIQIGIYATGIALPLPLSDALAIALVGDPFDNKTKRRTGQSYYR